MQKSYRQNQNINKNYCVNKSKQNSKSKRNITNQRNSPIMQGIFQPQKNTGQHGKLKSSSGFIGMNNLVSPTQSVFEKRIRQAIEMRYRKSKVSNYKYVKIQDSQFKQHYQDSQISFSSSQSSLVSEQMQEMKNLAYLKNITFVNIHHFHSQKYTPIKQTSKDKDRNRKRRFKVPLTFGNSNDQKNQSQSNNDKDEPLNNKINSNLNSNPIILKGKKPQQSQTLNCKEDFQINSFAKEKQKKFLTSRLPYKKEPITLQYENQKYLSTLSPYEQFSASQNKIKDTFKLNYSNKMLTKTIQNDEAPQNFKKQQQKTERSSQKTQTKTRRFLLQKNQKLKNIKTEPNQTSEMSYRIKNQKNDSFDKKITSLRKIQTGVVEPVPNQQQIYNRTTKNKAKMIKSYRNNNFLINRINQNSQKSFHSATQKKWKLQEISFKFKPVNELQKDSAINQIQKMEESKNHALKLGLSLQKAYSKLLNNNKKAQQKEKYSTRINNESQQKTNRRILRASPKNGNLLKINEQRESKLIKREQSRNFNSAVLIQNKSQESLSGQRGQLTKYKLLKKTKGERFSTIE